MIDLPDAASSWTYLRILCGAWFLPHTIAKLRHIDRAAEFFDKIRFRPPRFFVVLTALLEVVAMVSLVFDIHRRIGAIIATGILLVAAWAQIKVNGPNWRWQFKGAEYMIFWALVCLAVGFT
jgi:putative oxidoreductase